MSETLSPETIAPIFEHPRYVEGTTENTETLERFSAGLHELQQINPEIVGATLFGSRLKGEGKAESDVDTVVFVDADELKNRGVEVTVDELGQVGWGEHQDLKEGYRQHFGEFLASKTDKDPAVISSGLYIVPISHELIESELGKQLDYLKTYDEYRREMDVWVDRQTLNDPRPEQPELVSVDRNISGLFAPDMLDGLQEYQQDVIHILSHAGEYGERTWKEILDRVSFGEGHMDTANPAAYPTNLSEAKAWYEENYGQHRAAK